MKKFILILSIIFALFFTSFAYAKKTTTIVEKADGTKTTTIVEEPDTPQAKVKQSPKLSKPTTPLWGKKHWEVSLGIYGTYPYTPNMLSDSHNYTSRINNFRTYSFKYMNVSLKSFTHSLNYMNFDLQGLYHLNSRWGFGLRAVYMPKLFQATAVKYGVQIDKDFGPDIDGTKTVDVTADKLWAIEGLGSYSIDKLSFLGGLGFAQMSIKKSEKATDKCVIAPPAGCSESMYGYVTTHLGATPLDMYKNDQTLNSMLLSLGVSYQFYTYKFIEFKAVFMEDVYYGLAAFTEHYDKTEVNTVDPGTETYTIHPLLFNTSLGINIAFQW